MELNISQNEQLLIDRLNTANYILSMPQAEFNDLVQKYELALDNIDSTTNKIPVVLDNKDTYTVVGHPIVVFAALLRLTQSANNPMINFKEKFPTLSKVYMAHSVRADGSPRPALAIIQSTYEYLQSHFRLSGAPSIDVHESVSFDDIDSALKLFGVQTISESDASETDYEDEYSFDEDDDASIDMDDLFDSVDDTEDKGEDEPISLDEPESEPENKKEDTDEDEEDTSEKEKIEAIKHSDAYQFIETNVNNLINTYSILYASGFSGIANVGIMVPQSGVNANDWKPIATVGEINGTSREGIKPAESDAFDKLIMLKIGEILPEFSKIAHRDATEYIPNTDEIMNGSCICDAIQLQFMTGKINFCKGKTSIRSWISSEVKKSDSGVSNSDEWLAKNNSNQKNRLVNFKYVKQWYKWSLTNIICKAMIDLGLTGAITEYTQIKDVLNKLDSALRTVAVVSEHKKGVVTEIKLSSASIASGKVEPQVLIDALEGVLNGNGSVKNIKVTVRNEKAIASGVLTLAIIYNEESANSSNLFAKDVIEDIIRGGQAPSWGHVILGKNQDGSTLFYDDFKNPAKADVSYRCYTIYAGSRSGKGVMTSTLIASALCDPEGVYVFYTDGKPENGVCTGKIAWNKGKEAYIFDGQPYGAKPFDGPLENYTNGMRQPDEITQYMDKLPPMFTDGGFINREEQKIFLGVMRYLRSLVFMSEVVTARTRTLDNSKWAVWVFDEMTSMANREKTIRDKFASYLGSVGQGAKVDPGTLINAKNIAKFKDYIDKDNEKFDPNVLYIYNWSRWIERAKISIKQAATITLGKANTTLIFIFQAAGWIAERREDTLIGYVVNELKSTKIVGRGALSPMCRDYGDGTTINKPWYANYVNTEAKWWAISKSADLKTSDVKLFKPYNIYTIPIDPVTSELLTDEQVSNDKTIEQDRYLGGYIAKLERSIPGIDAAASLNAAYEYANYALNELQLSPDASNIKEYIYNCATFTINGEDVSIAALNDDLNEASETDEASYNSSEQKVYDSEDESEYVDDAINSDDEEDETETVTNNAPINTALFKSVLLSNQLKAWTGNSLPATHWAANIICDESAINSYRAKFLDIRAIQNAAFDFSDYDNKSSKGVRMAIILYRSIVILENADHDTRLANGLIDKYKRVIASTSSDQASIKYQNNCKIALGLIELYRKNIELPVLAPHDRIDNQAAVQKLLNQLVVTYTNKAADYAYEIAMQPEDLPFGIPDFSYMEETATHDYNNVPNEDGPMDTPFYRNVYGTNVMTSRPTQDAIKLQPGTFEVPKVNRSKPFFKFRRKLFESGNGTSYVFKCIFDEILKTIDKAAGDASMVTKLDMMEHQIVVNNRKAVMLDSILHNDEYCIDLEDVINFEKLLKRYMSLKDLRIQYNLIDVLMIQYGFDPAEMMNKLFGLSDKLMRITIIQADGSQTTFRRDQVTGGNTNKTLERQVKEREARMKVDQFAAANDPRLHKKSPGKIAKFMSSSKAIAKQTRNEGLGQTLDKHPRIAAVGGTSLAAVGIMTIGLPAVAAGFVAFNVAKLFRKTKR